MAGNTPNHGLDTLNSVSEEKNTQNNNLLSTLKDTVRKNAGAALLGLSLAVATPNVATAQETVDPNTVVVIEGKEYTYQQLYDMWVEERREILRKIPSRGERENIRSHIINLQDKAIIQARAENQRVRMREQQVNDLNRYFAIATHTDTPQRERAAAIQHVLRLVDELWLSEKEQADTIKAMEYAAKL